MTFATKLTVLRFLLIPVFIFYALSYCLSAEEGMADESLRRWALGVFIVASLTDWVDGWIARRFDQASALGAFLDPIADKLLTLSAVVILTFWDWGEEAWRIPWWFTMLVLLRDSVILLGIKIMWLAKCQVPIQPHWFGKVCTCLLFVVLGWVMLRVTSLSPIYPCALASLFLLLSMGKYIQQGIGILRQKN